MERPPDLIDRLTAWLDRPVGDRRRLNVIYIITWGVPAVTLLVGSVGYTICRESP